MKRCPAPPSVVGYWTVALVSSDPLEQHVQCDLGVRGPEFTSRLWLCGSCVSLGSPVVPSRGGKRWSVHPLPAEHQDCKLAVCSCALCSSHHHCFLWPGSMCVACAQCRGAGVETPAASILWVVVPPHTRWHLYFIFSSLLTVSLKESTPSGPKKPAKSKPAMSRDKASDAGDKQRQEARKELLAAKRAASVRQNSAHEHGQHRDLRP